MIPFDVPAIYQGALMAGELIRHGAILQDSATGRIVAHLQETGIGSQLFSQVSSSFSSPVSAISSLGANIQLSHLSRMVETLGYLQYANLGVSLVGAGVGVASYVVLSKKLNLLASKMDGLSQVIADRFERLEASALRTRFHTLDGIFDSIRQAHLQSHSQQLWSDATTRLNEQLAWFRGEVRHMVGSDQFDSDLFSLLMNGYATCVAARVETLMLQNESPAALEVSLNDANEFAEIDRALSAYRLAQNEVGREVLMKMEEVEYRETIARFEKIVVGVRDSNEIMVCKPMLLETLVTHDINGLEYVKQLQNEKQEALLALPVG